MAKYEHNGVEIDFREHNGKFFATIGGKRTEKASLDSMKKAIDEAAKTAFAPFDAYVISGWREFSKERIARVHESRHRGQTKRVFYTAENRECSKVYPCSPEVLVAHKAIESHQKETRRIDDERRAELDELSAKLDAFEIDPATYKPAK